MSILDIFKKEALDNDDLNKLKQEIEQLQKTQVAERESLLSEQETLKSQLEQEKNRFAENEKKLAEITSSFENDKVKLQKELAVFSQLTQDGANPKLIKLLKKEIDFDSLEIDNDVITNWDKVGEPVKTQYADFFNAPETKGIDPVKPLEKPKEEKDPFLEGFKS